MNIENRTSVVINLATRYAAAFGLSKIDQYISNAVVTNEDNRYDIQYFSDFDPNTEKIRLEHSSLSVEFGSMLVFNEKNEQEESTVFAPPLMMDFRRSKEIIITETNGDDNVIIERWNTQPWEISMKGILIDVQNRHYPSDQIRKLHQLFKINDVLEVFGVQFEEKDIDAIYLKDISITPLEGFSDTIQFSFTASSIKSVSWNLLKPSE
ncbi:MAG: DUF6046 domain-containing protein [Bergeyella cardium]|nr:MAG TPA: hypothetical protein [Caudoviricetes sp.]